MSGLKAYATNWGAHFRSLLQYRVAAWAGFGTQTFFGLVSVMVYTGFFGSTSAPQPLTFSQTIDYVWLGQALFALIPMREDPQIATAIRSGDICFEILRPVRLYAFWFARALAQRTAPVLLRAVPMLLLVVVVFPLVGLRSWALGGPASAAGFALFLVSVVGAVLLSATFSLLMSLSLLWTVAAEGVSTLFPIAVWTLCGIVVPLPFFPNWAQPILAALPFRGLMDVPFRIYMGNFSPLQAVGQIASQLAWAAGLMGVGALSLARGLRRLTLQGG